MLWLKALQRFTIDNESCVVVMITDVEGSAPRAVGTRMVVTLDAVHDTIGGGALELEAISHARALLASHHCVPLISSRQLSLGQALSQCCGGRVTLQFDIHKANDFIVHVFGAGHVAQELARILPRLPCRATFHDPRVDWLGQVERCVRQIDTMEFAGSEHSALDAEHAVTSGAQASTVRTRLLPDNPYWLVEQCESAAYYVIMTHSHDLDLELVEAVISRGDAAYCGLIASQNKARSFKKRLLRKGFTDAELEQLTAPLGRHIKTGSTPVEVAVAAVSDLLNCRQMRLSGERTCAQTLD